MARRNRSPLSSLTQVPEVREAAAALVAAVEAASSEKELTADAYTRAISDVERTRGRPLMFPMLASGIGRGARVRLADGSEKLDFIGGIGVYAFGHSDRDLLEHAVIAAAADTVFQGHLLPGPEYLRLSRLLVKHAGRRIRHAVNLPPMDRAVMSQVQPWADLAERCGRWGHARERATHQPFLCGLCLKSC